MKEKKRKKILKSVLLGLLVGVLVGGVGTVSYAFFNYTNTGINNLAQTGGISFRSEETDNISLTNAYPITRTQAASNTTNTDDLVISVIGDTTYSGGIEYIITATNVTNTVGNKTIPISIIVTASNLGTSDNSYYSNRGANANSSIYKVLANETILANDDQLLVGYIKSGVTGVNGTLTIRAFLDTDKIIISDTYTLTQNDINEGKVVLSTTEWNSITGNNALSFKIKVEAKEGVWIREPVIPICRRVTNSTNLHTETCNRGAPGSSYSNSPAMYCYEDGYTENNSTITYGNAVPFGTSTLSPGDAFDCKVSTTGDYTERFYYVSQYYDTTNEIFDSSYATLIYYTNTVNGVVNNGGAAYDSSGQNSNGPITALTHLPSTSTWDNIRLKATTRTIWACDGPDCNSKSLTASAGIITPNPFSYGESSTRLLTIQEIIQSGCLELSEKSSLEQGGSLGKCNFLLEGTKYADSSAEVDGICLENPGINTSYGQNTVYQTAPNRYVWNIQTSSTIGGVRPVIDVPLSKIEY